MKTACTYFQCAAWVFQALRERYGSLSEADDMTDDLFHIYNLISLVSMVTLISHNRAVG